MAIPAGKTPISYLQEYCTKRGLTPEYELLSHEGTVHEPTFIMKVKVGEATADGKSTSKKKAKHCAARAVLGILLGMQNGVVTENDGVGDETADTKDDKGVGNPVGELQEFTQKKLIRPPIYTFDNDQRQPHERKFFCTVKLGKMEEKGEGRSKRASKRDAAGAMLAHINKLAASGGDADHLLSLQPESEVEKKEPETNNTYMAENDHKPTLLAPQQSRELQLFYETIMQRAGKQLKSAIAPAPSTTYCQMLQEIADTERFDVALFEVEERTTLGHFQTILKLTTTPVTVCHGCGLTHEDARASAAHNALQYLRIMTKQ